MPFDNLKKAQLYVYVNMVKVLREALDSAGGDDSRQQSKIIGRPTTSLVAAVAAAMKELR